MSPDAERAALELAGQGSGIAGAAGGAPARRGCGQAHDDDRLATLVWLIALIDVGNWVNVITGRPPASACPARGVAAWVREEWRVRERLRVCRR